LERGLSGGLGVGVGLGVAVGASVVAGIDVGVVAGGVVVQALKNSIVRIEKTIPEIFGSADKQGPLVRRDLALATEPSP
jgi:hypothetical protein